jgi:hypothetical protein
MILFDCSILPNLNPVFDGQFIPAGDGVELKLGLIFATVASG